VEQANEAILTAVKGLQLGDASIEGNKITVAVTNPDKENPAILESIFRAGGRIQSVDVVGSTLEDAYLKLVREQK
jgi:hypothetical protein